MSINIGNLRKYTYDISINKLIEMSTEYQQVECPVIVNDNEIIIWHNVGHNVSIIVGDKISRYLDVTNQTALEFIYDVEIAHNLNQ